MRPPISELLFYLALEPPRLSGKQKNRKKRVDKTQWTNRGGQNAGDKNAVDKNAVDKNAVDSFTGRGTPPLEFSPP